MSTCSRCAAEGRRGYCAPLRCYCGHPTCHAFASYVEVKPPEMDDVRAAPTSSAWTNREEPTWIDQM